jgi:nitrogenase subunit NifH
MLYIFIGMFQGIITRVEPYMKKPDAVKAWSKYTEIKYTAFEEDDSLLKDSKYEGSSIYTVDLPLECINTYRKIAITWDIDDVKTVRPDLSEAQAMQVLQKVHDKHDAEMGVSWATLETWAGILFPLAQE